MAKIKEQQPQPQKPPQRPAPAPNAGSRYFREVRSEISKVIWPSREQATNLTLIVLSVMVVMGLFLGFMDVLFGEIIRQLINLLGQ